MVWGCGWSWVVGVGRWGRVVVSRSIVGNRSRSIVHCGSGFMMYNRCWGMVDHRRGRMVIQGGKCRFWMVHRGMFWQWMGNNRGAMG